MVTETLQWILLQSANSRNCKCPQWQLSQSCSSYPPWQLPYLDANQSLIAKQDSPQKKHLLQKKNSTSNASLPLYICTSPFKLYIFGHPKYYWERCNAACIGHSNHASTVVELDWIGKKKNSTPYRYPYTIRVIVFHPHCQRTHGNLEASQALQRTNYGHWCRFPAEKSLVDIDSHKKWLEEISLWMGMAELVLKFNIQNNEQGDVQLLELLH